MKEEEKIKLLERLVEAQQKLLVCYRIGGRPSEKVLDTIDICKRKLNIV